MYTHLTHGDGMRYLCCHHPGCLDSRVSVLGVRGVTGDYEGMEGLGMETLSKMEQQKISREVKLPNTESTIENEVAKDMVSVVNQGQKENKPGARCSKSTLASQINSLDQFLADQVLILERSKKRASWKRRVKDTFYVDYAKEGMDQMENCVERKRSYEVAEDEVLGNNGFKKQKGEHMEVMETNAIELVKVVIQPINSYELSKLELPRDWEPSDS